MAVFISHRQADEQKALGIKKFLAERGVDAYVDVLDPTLKTATDITRIIITQLNKCTHIIAVFTNNTKGSYWVPFELGAAYEADKGIASYIWDDPEPQLPDYLDAFPKMRNGEDLQKFIHEIKGSDLLEYKDRYVFEKTASARHADRFIARLKSRLGQ